MQSKFKYFVNDVEQTFMRRIYPTKTFKIIAALVVAQTILLVKDQISFEVYFKLVTEESLLVVLRAVASKLELSNHAANPNIENVVVEPVAGEA